MSLQTSKNINTNTLYVDLDLDLSLKPGPVTEKKTTPGCNLGIWGVLGRW